MAATSVLSRKLSQGGIARAPLNDADLVCEGLARGVEDRLRTLVKTITGATVEPARVTKLADATAAITSPSMLGVIEVEDADTPALVAMESGLAYHLIDLTLGGDPAASPEPGERAFTAIDMALLRLHLDAILAAFGQAIGAGLGSPLTKTMRVRDQRQSLSQLRLAPDYIDVLIFDVGLALGEAGRRGGFSLVLPLSTLDVIRASIQARNTESARDRPNDLWKAVMRRAAAGAPVTVDGVLHHQSLSLSALQGLAVGQILHIPRQAVDEIRLTIPQPGGRTAVLATGRLGAFQENKVVKLAIDPDRRVIAHIERALTPVAALPRARAIAPPAGRAALPAPEAQEAADADKAENSAAG